MNKIASKPDNPHNGPKPKSIARLFVERTAMRFASKLIDSDKLADKIVSNYNQASQERYGQPDKALRLLEKGVAFAEKTNSANLHLLLDSALELSKKTKPSETADKAFEIARTNVTLISRKKNLKSIAPIYDKLAEQTDNLALKERYVKKANEYDLAGSEARYKKLVASYEKRGNDSLESGYFSHAIINYDKAIELDPSVKERVYRKLADAFKQLGDKEFDPSVKELCYKKLAVVFEQLGDKNRKLGLLLDAIENYKEAIEFDPSVKERCHWKLAGIYEKQGNNNLRSGMIHEAVIRFEQANEYDQSRASSRYYWVSKAYAERGDKNRFKRKGQAKSDLENAAYYSNLSMQAREAVDD